MVQGGEVDTGNSEYLTQGVLEIIQGSKKLQEEEKNFLDKNKDLKDLDLTEEENVILLLSSRKSEEFLAAMSKALSEEEKFKKLAEQVGKNRVMEEKLEALGNQLLAQGVISGAAVTTLTGALAGTLAIGGVTGALIGGGAAFVGFVALVAIGYAIYQNRSEIKEGAIEFGKAVKSFVKDVIDAFAWEKTNFSRLQKQFVRDMVYSTDNEKSKEAQNKIRIIEILKNEEQRSAIKGLIEDGIIQDFSEKDMTKLVEKGDSTHKEDMQKLLSLMQDFLPAIMVIGEGKIEKVEEIISEKAQKVKPSPKVENPSSERVSGEEKGVN
ncbi:glycine zipper family protein [Wolbachia endosymbiont of Encarsia formosa]|uniref:glycine zipper family protein n=1 Tax=Wolbachia endosymbiont of Encarsia formosa TaxID=77125 RepID=UPI0031BB0E9F